MATLNIFCYGTGERPDKTINFITQFSQACLGERIIVEGPDVLGTKVTKNAQKVTEEIVTWLKNQKSEAHHINFTGFSRGAVTCIHIANLLKKKELALQSQKERLEQMGQQLTPENEQLLSQLKQMELNQFLVDPVAGIMDKGKIRGRNIPDNIKNCVILLPLDEQRRDFKPQDMTRLIVDNPQTTRISLLPLYGNHTDCTKIKNENMQSGAIILWHSLYHFLIQHGTRFQEHSIPRIVYSNHYKDAHRLAQHPSAKELLQLYSEHHAEREHYRRSGNKIILHDGIPVPRTPRTINKHLGFYVKNAHFFVNQMERELFKLSWPKTFNYLFEKNQLDLQFPNDSQSSKQDVLTELVQLREEHPLLFNRLKSRGVTEAEQTLSLGPPRGFYTLEQCATLSQITPYLIPDLLKQHTHPLSRLNTLEQEVYRAMFQYQRDKSSFNWAGERTESQRASNIRRMTNRIVNNSKTDETSKYNRILDELEHHFRTLSLINEYSDLTLTLQTILSRHNRHFLILEPSAANKVLIQAIQIVSRLLKELVSFIGNLGYVGGFVLHSVGYAAEDLGRRFSDLIGQPGYNPLKYVALAITTTIEGLGFVIKNSLGLKVFTDFLVYGINQIKKTALLAINTTAIERIEADKSTKAMNRYSLFKPKPDRDAPESTAELQLKSSKAPL